MKRCITILLACLIVGTYNVCAGTQITITSRYQPIDYSTYYEAMSKNVETAIKNHRKLENEISNFENELVSMLTKEMDAEMRDFLTAKHKQVCNLMSEFQEKDVYQALGLRTKLIKLKQEVNTEIINYNNRVAAHNAEVERKRQEEERLAREEAERIAKEEAERNANWSGTGFALRNKYIVTNYHVIEEARTIKILGINSDFHKEYSAKVCVTDRSNDLALLEIVDDSFAGFGVVPYYTKTQMAEVGESVFVLGYPLTSTMGEEIKLTTGVISSRTGFQGDVSSYQFSAPIQPGNSGAPLFDNKGNLIGIVSAKHTGAENAGYAIKTSYLKQLTDCVATSGILPYNSHTANVPLTDKVKKIKNFVFIIKCSKRSEDEYLGAQITTPYVERKEDDMATINKVIITPTSTDIEIKWNNKTPNGGYKYCSIKKDTYILANGVKYFLTSASNIKIKPEQTEMDFAGQFLFFTLHFPPIPSDTATIDLIEPEESNWKFYGIKLK